MAEPSSLPEPSVDPSYLLRAVRVFTAAVTDPEEKNPSSDTAEVAGEDAGDTLGWEQAGCLVWDVAGLPDDAAFLLGHGLPAMLPPLLAAAAAREQWRVLEIGLGVAANLACHKEAREQLLQLEGLPELLLDQLLWVDDSASLAELCRCTAGLLPDAARDEASERWWVLLLREETLGRLVWILENTLASSLLERALNLLVCLVTAGVAAKASGDGSKAVLVPQLTVLGLLPLLASVLHGWAVKLQAEGQHFGAEEGRGGEGGSGGGSPAAAGSGGSAGPAAGREKLPAAKRAGSAAAGIAGVGPAAEGTSPAAAAAAAIDDSGLEGDAAAGGAVAAEVTEVAVLEALALLEALAADVAGEAALNASAPIKDALLRTVAEADQRSTQALATSLLAGLEGVGPQLLAQPAALAALLRRLATAAEERTGKRAKTNAGPGSGGGAAGPGSEEEQAEEVEATWALCSALARALSAEAATEAEGEEAAREPGQLGTPAMALGMLAEQVDALCHDWGSSPRAAAIQMHQAYVLRRLGPLLEPRLEGPGKQTLQDALARC